MDITIKGKLIDCVINPSKDGKKTYFTLIVYNNGSTYRIGVPDKIYNEYTQFVNQEVEIDNVSIWCEGKTSLYIKE